MKKSMFLNLVHVLVCELSDGDVAFEDAKIIMKKVLDNDMSFIEMLPSNVLISFMEMFTHLQDFLGALVEEDKVLLSENLINHFYKMMGYVAKMWDKSLSFKERELASFNQLLKQISITVLFAYISEGVNLNSQYAAFKIDYRMYAKNLGLISELADKKQVLRGAIATREKEARLLVQKYKCLDLSEEDLKTVFEKELFLNQECIEQQGDEIKNFNSIAV